MRQAGLIPDQEQALRLGDYLLTQGIAVRVEPAAEGWVVWVRDEEHVARATHELDQFVANPADSRYFDAEKAADALRREKARRETRARKNFVDVRERWQFQTSGSAPVTLVLILVSVAVFLGMEWNRESDALQQRLSIAGYEFRDGQVTWDRLDQIVGGQVWRLVTPIWLHFGLAHIVFNMMALHQLGGLVERVRGSWIYAPMIVLLAVVSNLVQYQFGGHPVFGGMSGVVFGLFGYAWMKTRFDPGAGIYLHSNSIAWMLIFFLLCLTGLIGPIANWAHAAGLATGMAIGYAAVAWRNLRRRLRPKH